MRALACLPQTLDETYERIFLQIPSSARIFVHHALKWIYFHREIHKRNMNCTTFLTAVHRSASGFHPAGYGDYLFDEDLLREFCGCLISLETEDPIYDPNGPGVVTVSFAHYTVWEFLCSERMKTGPAAFFAVSEETTRLEFAKVALLESLASQHNQLWDAKTFAEDSARYDSVFADDFNAFSIATSITIVHNWESSLSGLEDDDLMTLVFDLFDSTKPHYHHFAYAMKMVVMPQKSIGDEDWNIFWREPVRLDLHVKILLRILVEDWSGKLTMKFLQRAGWEDVLGRRFDLGMELHNVTRDRKSPFQCRFQGTVVELFAQLAMKWEVPIHILLGLEPGYFDPSAILLYYIGSHVTACMDCQGVHGQIFGCLVSRLLELGATPTSLGYLVGPLQIATATWDFDGVLMLLKAGADPNDAGDRGGIEWEAGTMMSIFNYLRNSCPLQILENFPDHPVGYSYWLREKETARKIKDLLLHYGARELTNSGRG